MEVGGAIFLIVALVFYAIIASSQGDGKIEGSASTVDNLPNDALLSGSALWQIIIFRKSGNVHDVRELYGEADDAIAKAISSCRRAGIYSLIVTDNEPAKLEFYSSNQEGRGKAIGGFRITAISEISFAAAISTDHNGKSAEAKSQRLSEQADTAQETQIISDQDEFGFPAQDAWEGSVYELGGRPLRCDVKLGFSYTDSNGALTNRQIRTKAFVPWLDNDHLVLGFCNYRKANRSFVTSRMDDVFDLETGECIDDIDRYLTEIYEKSDYKKIDEFIDERMSVVECLLYLAKLDGNLTTAQKSLIISYIAETSGVAMVTDSVASKLIKDFAEDLTPQEFRKLLSQIRREQPENLAALRDLGPKVVGARRNGAGGGQAALTIIFDKKAG